MIKSLPAALLIAAVGSAATAQTVDFIIVDDGVRDLTTMTLTDPGTGLSLTIDNPRDNTLFSNNTFARILGGLFIDGGLAPTLDWTFSQDVKLVEYVIANQDNFDLFTLTQGPTVSANNTTDPLGTFPFTNTSDIFTGGSPITLTTSDHSGNGYSISRITVELAASLIGDDYIADLYIGGSLFTSNNDTALVGPDADGTWNSAGSLPYDIEARTINVESSSTTGSWVPGIGFEFRDLDFNDPTQRIVGVNILRATGNGWSNIDLSDISFTADSVRIDASKIEGITPALDQGITVEVIPGPISNFIGDDYIANYYYLGGLRQTRNDTALVGPDAIGNFEGNISYDIEPDNTLTIRSITSCCQWAPAQMFEFLDLDVAGGGSIVDVIVIDATGTGWSNIDDSDVSFTADSILIDAIDIVGITPALNQSVTLQIITSAGVPCPGDIADDFGSPGADGMVSFGDFLALLGLVGPCPGGTPGCAGDIADDFGTIGNLDGQVSFGDFLALLGLVGPCP